MTCHGGCVGGAGQPHALKAVKEERRNGLYEVDRNAPFKRAEYNPNAFNLRNGYNEEERHHLFHVSYVKD